jgi:pyruvate kinase
LAKDRNVACIAVFTRSGKTARLMSKTRPDVPIIAFTPEITTYQQLNILWGITPFLVPYASNVESMVSHVEAIMVSNKLLKSGQQFVLISGFPVGAMRPPNLAMLHTVGDPV